MKGGGREEILCICEYRRHLVGGGKGARYKNGKEMIDRRRWLIEDESEENGRSTLSASLQAGGFHSAAGIVCPFFSGRPRAIPRGGR